MPRESIIILDDLEEDSKHEDHEHQIILNWWYKKLFPGIQPYQLEYLSKTIHPQKMEYSSTWLIGYVTGTNEFGNFTIPGTDSTQVNSLLKSEIERIEFLKETDIVILSMSKVPTEMIETIYSVTKSNFE